MQLLRKGVAPETLLSLRGSVEEPIKNKKNNPIGYGFVWVGVSSTIVQGSTSSASQHRLVRPHRS